jgi:8-oxo-dGTP diphosphatase
MEHDPAMALVPDGFVLDLVPHCASVSRNGWIGDHDVRPLSATGFEQAEALVAALGTGIDGVFSSPALRCRQTVAPAAAAAHLEVATLDAMAEADGFPEPAAWVSGIFAPMAGAVGGAWAGGRMARAVMTMADRHPGGHVVACSHGDVIPVFLALICGAVGQPVPALAERGEWYRLTFDRGTVRFS